MHEKTSADGKYTIARVTPAYDIGSGGLSLSRSLGDGTVKDIGVTAEPVVTHRKLNFAEDTCLVLACDGVWDYVSSDEAVGICQSNAENATAAARAIVHTAWVTRGSHHAQMHMRACASRPDARTDAAIGAGARAGAGAGAGAGRCRCTCSPPAIAGSVCAFTRPRVPPYAAPLVMVAHLCLCMCALRRHAGGNGGKKTWRAPTGMISQSPL